MADTDITITGLYHLQGRTVSVVICGLDCGDYLVTTDSGTAMTGGNVVVPIGSDPDGLLSGAYIALFDVGPYDGTTYGNATAALTVFNAAAGGEGTYYVPVCIGFTYTSIGQPLRPATAEQGKSQMGPLLGKTRRNHRFSALLNNTQGVSFGPNLSTAIEARFTNIANVVTTKDQLYSGVWQDTVADDYTLEGGVGWLVSRPYPCAVMALGGFMDTSER